MSISSTSENQVVFRGNILYFFAGIFTLFMVVPEIKVAYDLLPSKNNCTFGNIFGFIFMCVWLLVGFGMSIAAFTISSKKVIVNSEGILCRTWFSKKKLLWSEIKNWGIFNSTFTNNGENTYYFYFLKKQSSIKIHKRATIKILIRQYEYEEILYNIIPLCSKWTDVKPFIYEKDKQIKNVNKAENRKLKVIKNYYFITAIVHIVYAVCNIILSFFSGILCVGIFPLAVNFVISNSIFDNKLDNIPVKNEEKNSVSFWRMAKFVTFIIAFFSVIIAAVIVSL